MKIEAGMEIVVDALEWSEPRWEFDNPSMILRPVLRTAESGHVDELIEELLTDAVVEGVIEDDTDVPGWLEFQGWNLQTLRRRWREAMEGKAFPVRAYQAVRRRVRFLNDKDGDLTWEVVTE